MQLFYGFYVKYGIVNQKIYQNGKEKSYRVFKKQGA